MSTDPRHWISVLRASHGNLAGAVAALGPDRATDQSYCRDWSVAQVLSHLGSGAEISLLTLRSAIGEGEPVGPDGFPPIWDRWNAKAPADQIADGLAADEEHISTAGAADRRPAGRHQGVHVRHGPGRGRPDRAAAGRAHDAHLGRGGHRRTRPRSSRPTRSTC